MTEALCIAFDIFSVIRHFSFIISLGESSLGYSLLLNGGGEVGHLVWRLGQTGAREGRTQDRRGLVSRKKPRPSIFSSPGDDNYTQLLAFRGGEVTDGHVWAWVCT